jgi:hypothetical protein
MARGPESWPLRSGSALSLAGCSTGAVAHARATRFASAVGAPAALDFSSGQVGWRAGSERPGAGSALPFAGSATGAVARALHLRPRRRCVCGWSTQRGGTAGFLACACLCCGHLRPGARAASLPRQRRQPPEAISCAVGGRGLAGQTWGWCGGALGPHREAAAVHGFPAKVRPGLCRAGDGDASGVTDLLEGVASKPHASAPTCRIPGESPALEASKANDYGVQGRALGRQFLLVGVAEESRMARRLPPVWSSRPLFLPCGELLEKSLAVSVRVFFSSAMVLSCCT